MSENSLARRGTTNTNVRGSALDRRARKNWVLNWFGDGAVCLCYSCAAELTYTTVQIDRIIPGRLGGTYARGNIRPACPPCNRRSGFALQKLLRQGVAVTEILALCREGVL